MDQAHVIRHKVLSEKKSIRAVAREMKVSRNTVRRYVEGAIPGERAGLAGRTNLEQGRARQKVRELLASSKEWTEGKQRVTAQAVHRMVQVAGVKVGLTVVKQEVREWRRAQREVYVPLVYAAGDVAQVDFFEVWVDLAGERQKAWMFLMRLVHSGRDFACVYPRQDQVCFLDGHVRAFAHLGAVPHRVVYDNLRPAVKRVLVGSERELAPRFQALASHYVFEPCFARVATGHDKGSVEARGKGIRWQHLVPIPRGDSLAAISATLQAQLDAQAQAGDGSIMSRFREELGRMLPLPGRAFSPAAKELLRISRSALVRAAGAQYSVPVRYAGLDATVYTGVDEVVVALPDGTRVVHPRVPPGKRSVRYLDYLPELARKPQALRQVMPELLKEVPAAYAAAWRELVDHHGPRQAARLFADLLAVALTDGLEVVASRLARALEADLPLPLALVPERPEEPELPQAGLPSILTAVVVEAALAADYDALVPMLRATPARGCR